MSTDTGTTVSRSTLKREIRHHRGRDNAITSTELAHILGCKDTTVRDAVQDLVHDANLIASCQDGYYRISSVDELRDEVQSLRSSARTSRERALTLIDEWERLEDDLGIPGPDPVKDPAPAIEDALLAVHNAEYDTAERALLQALSRLRRTQQEARP